MKKLIAKIREWLRALLREELALVITEFHEIKDVRLVQAEDEAAKLLQGFEQKLMAEAAVVVSEKNKLIAEIHAAHEMLHTHVNTVEEHFIAERANFEAETKNLLKDFEQKLSAEAATVITGKNVAIAELHEKVKNLQTALHKVTQWRADEGTVEADHSLKMVK